MNAPTYYINCYLGKSFLQNTDLYRQLFLSNIEEICLSIQSHDLSIVSRFQ